MGKLPAGALTFLLTDIEGSTRLWEANPSAMRVALKRHDALLSTSIKGARGTVLRDRGEGDSFFAIFQSAGDAVAAACSAQRALHREVWPAEAALRVRMALHSGQAEPDYWDPIINRCSRLRALAHGGQTLLSAATEELAREELPAGASLRNLGERRLRDLTRPERIFQLLHPDLPADFAALASLETFPNNLPIQLTRFIGREREVGEIKDLLLKASLLTLTGAAGCGKTRLALQVAADLLDRHPDGVWLVELAPLSDPALVTQSVASTLRIREEAGRPLVDTLTAHLKAQRTLLILDNCEHLVDECARLAEGLLHACPSLHILATSREALNVGGEVSWRVPSLSLPAVGAHPRPDELARGEAVRLFLDRALLARPDFLLSEQNGLAVVQVCERLDGIPLAIELAAARVKLMPVDAILGRLEDRFRLLTSGSRTALPRQQTLQAAVEWSYRLLTEPERILFNRLSVFAGGLTLEAADAVCAGDGLASDRILDLLGALVDKSLVVVDEGGAGPSRYTLLETLRQYGGDRLAEGSDQAARRRHADYFLAMAEEVESKLGGPDQAGRLQQLEDEHDNMRTALSWLIDTEDGEPAVRLASTLVQFWMLHGHVTEGRQWLTDALAGTSGSPAIRAKALLGEGRLAWRQADYAVAASSIEKSLALSRELGDKPGVARALVGLGAIATEQGDDPTARSYLEQSLAVAREMGDSRAIARALSNLAGVAFQRGDYGTAHTTHEQALALHREIGDPSMIALSLGNLAETLLEQADHAGARSHYAESLTLFRRVGEQVGIGFCLDGFSALAAAYDQPERALRLAGAAAAQRKAVGSIVAPSARAKLESRLEPARRALAPGAAADAWDRGGEMSLDQAVAEAMAVEVPQPIPAK